MIEPHNITSFGRLRPALKCPLILGAVLLPALLSAQGQPGSAAAGSMVQPLPDQRHSWTTSASLSFKEAYDSDVFMQEVTPLANHASAVTIITPALGAQWKPNSGFYLTLGYAPEIALYHEASSENYVTHRGTINLGGKLDDTTWELLNNITGIQGNNLSPTFTGPGGAPAIGGVPLRDRRDAVIYRGGFKLQYPIGNWFLRPVASVYVHDFMTEQRTTAGYQNYASRSDINGGLDAGYQLFKSTELFAGYRRGAQGQESIPGAGKFRYSNVYDRLLAGIACKPADWLKFNLAIGPDFRSFGPSSPGPATGFDRNKTRLFLDFSATAAPTKLDVITAAAKQYELPGYGGNSEFEDTLYELTWRHKCTDRLTAGIGARAEHWNFELPVIRDEWWYNANVSAGYSFDKHWTASMTYGYDRILSGTANTSGRESYRHLASLEVKYTF